MTTASIGTDHYRVKLQDGRHEFGADEPMEQGGTDTAPSPDELMEASLASCTVITLRMYADRKQWPVTGINATVTLERTETNTVFTRHIFIDGDISEEQRERMLQVASSCPVSKTLKGAITISSSIE
jgi:putative redox protein